MPRRSAGILLYRTVNGVVEVLLVHPGGPFYSRRDLGNWGIPKGEYEPDEEPQACAVREFAEELGQPPPIGPMTSLGEIRQKNNKIVTAWGLEGDLDADAIQSNTFTAEWPPRTGRMQEFPEIDRAAWLSLDAAAAKIIETQRPLLDRLAQALGRGGPN
ncbi:MAG TPA: NUDIX domain-containing protein [Solirubrobacteraceae bacterium]|jgi:predicted NUDIX family NTP pyrophosphohydrolase|nr:NUDIX domain-containing protein [Solirubrobacteraceae bacterium]